MVIRGNLASKITLAIVVIAMTFSPLTVLADNHIEELELQDLLPQYNNFEWTYHGSVEYGHDMQISSMMINEMSTNYAIEGSVHDMSGGESDMDYSLNLDYSVRSDVIIQTKSEEVMLDSEYDEIELIRTPLKEGTSWSQEVENSEGATTLESRITDVENTDEGWIFKVRYEDINSDYYEERKIQEGVGAISFEKLMFFEEDSYPMGYSLYEAASGVELDIDFSDVSGDEWYVDHVAKLVTLALIEGYPDGTFRPDGQITVAEFIKVAVESLSYYQEGTSSVWFEPYVSKALELGLIEEGEFEDYNRPITRQEMTKIIIKATGEEPQSGQLSFADSSEVEAEFAPYIYTAVELGIIKGYPSDNTFRPDRTSTRAEASKLFVILVEELINMEPFTAEEALILEVEFENRLYH
ncbi:S-layer homology domain-containing protein [Gudongella sp. SC589]|uniref:S-layer homology domain-containing protein n=1 Tax=Gudongella sp. SC589 TaxID=3385990 RepID=UPI0039049639